MSIIKAGFGDRVSARNSEVDGIQIAFTIG
jgi:hypothetical protein